MPTYRRIRFSRIFFFSGLYFANLILYNNDINIWAARIRIPWFGFYEWLCGIGGGMQGLLKAITGIADI